MIQKLIDDIPMASSQPWDCHESASDRGIPCACDGSPLDHIQ